MHHIARFAVAQLFTLAVTILIALLLIWDDERQRTPKTSISTFPRGRNVNNCLLH